MWLAVLVSMVGALVTMGGVLAVRRWENWARDNKSYFISFAAGVLIAVSLLHLIPESFRLAPSAPFGLVVGYFLIHLLDRFVAAKVCDRTDSDYGLALVPLVGIGFHSFLDGVVYSVGFSVGALTGLLMAFGMILHEFPEGIVTYTLLLCSGHGPRRAAILTLIAAAFSTPAGTVLSFPLVDELNPPMTGFLLSASAGALLYVGATHLLPQTTATHDRFTLVALLGGIAVAVVVALTG